MQQNICIAWFPLSSQCPRGISRTKKPKQQDSKQVGPTNPRQEFEDPEDKPNKT